MTQSACRVATLVLHCFFRVSFSKFWFVSKCSSVTQSKNRNHSCRPRCLTLAKHSSAERGTWQKNVLNTPKHPVFIRTDDHVSWADRTYQVWSILQSQEDEKYALIAQCPQHPSTPSVCKTVHITSDLSWTSAVRPFFAWWAQHIYDVYCNIYTYIVSMPDSLNISVFRFVERCSKQV